MTPPPPPPEENGAISFGGNSDDETVIKRVKKSGHSHHGGAWKIAYADFMTAMMAFFLLMWLISSASEEQKQAIAEYFAPPNITATQSGAGGTFGGTAPEQAGAQNDGRPAARTEGVQDISERDLEHNGDQVSSASRSDVTSQDRMSFESAAVSIRQAWQDMPEIAQISQNLLVEVTEEGLNIQIVDQEHRRMFPENSKYPYEVTRKALAQIAPILQRLPNQIKISGHTTAGVDYPNPKYGPWELSADRANVSRSILEEFGLSQDHIYSVVGRATEEPFFPNDPTLAANERIKIVAMYAPPPVPAGLRP